jgi:hypothetical protein
MFKGQTTTTVNQIMGEAGFQWSTAADGTRKSFFYVEPAGVGGLLSTGMLQLYSDGGLNVSGYTVTSPGANIINTATGYTVGQVAPTSGKVLQSNGTAMIYSTPTWPTTAGTAGYTLRSDGTNVASYPQDMLNSSVASQATFSTSDIYIAGSNVTVAAGDFKAKGQYHCVFDMTKSAGTGAIVISVRAGTLGTTGDTAQLTFTFGAGTSVADTGVFDVFVTWRTVGSGTSAVIQGVCRAQKNAATTTGLWNNTGTDLVIVATTSSGFASNTFTNIGLSFNGGTAFAGTGTLVQATLVQ